MKKCAYSDVEIYFSVKVGRRRKIRYTTTDCKEFKQPAKNNDISHRTALCRESLMLKL